MKQRFLWPVRILTALCIGAGCAVYAPFAAFSLTWLAALKLVLWGGFGLLCTFGLRGKLHRRLLRFTVPLSFLLALSFVLGAQLQVYDTLAFDGYTLVTLPGLWLLWFLLLCHLFLNVPVWLNPKKRPRRKLNNTALLWAVVFGFCVLASTWLLAFYPIMTNYDIHAHLSQIAGGQYLTHHSLLYTLLMQALLWLSSALGFTNAWAFMLLGLLQMLVMGLAIGYGLVTMNTAGADRRAVLAAAFYYCLFPLFGYFAFSTTKDTLFACFLLLAATELFRLTRGGGIRCMTRFVVFSVLACLFRYNGAATLLLFLGLNILYALYRLLRRKPVARTAKRLLVLLPVILLLQTGTASLLNLATGATTPDTVRRDMLSLPLQQMARVLQDTDNETDIARIEGLFGVDDIKDRYRSDIADPVKAAFLYPDDNVVNALRAWVKLGFKYPKAYLEAFLQLTRGAWFTDDLSHTKIDYWLSYTGYLETTQKYTEAAFPIEYQSFLPGLKAFWERTFMDNDYLNVPLVRYLFALAVQTWVTLLSLCYAVYHRRQRSATLGMLVLCVLLPIFLLPCMISRYFLPLFLLNPLCLTALTTHEETV